VTPQNESGKASPASQSEEQNQDEVELINIALGNIERHVDLAEDATPDAIFNECYTLAFDALHDSGKCNLDTARRIATAVAQRYAQP